MNEKSVLLISFHNQKALGVRFLEKSLKSNGYSVNVMFFKGFNSIKPNSTTTNELNLLKSVIDELNPELIGLSVMTSLYLETVYAVNEAIRQNYKTPIVWGGVYPTLFPEKCLQYADFVIRGEGEKAVVELADSLFNDAPFENIENLSYRKNGVIKINDVRALCQDLDSLGYPEIGGNNKYYINNNNIFRHDPLLDSVSYELSASRGCPFVCSYCSSVSLRRVYRNGGEYVRFRSVSSVMSELEEAKAKIKKLKVIHFWDEIFSYDSDWVDEFVSKYKTEINLPFEIWGHPLKIDKQLINKLVDAGLYKVVMGIQSGSPHIRKDIFHRVETQEDIINAGNALSECKVPQIIYDFMLQHPFESEEDIRQTYELCTKLKPPFELQLHGLNFLPGTDIVDMAVKMDILKKEQLEEVMYSPMQEQYKKYWNYANNNAMSNFWYSLIFLTQFKGGRAMAAYLAKRNKSPFKLLLAQKLYGAAKPLARLRYYNKKGKLVLRALSSGMKSGKAKQRLPRYSN